MGQTAPFRILDLVCLLTPVTTEHGGEVAADTFGTVVAVYAGGEAYEVEFVHGLATVEAGRLTAALM